MVVKSQNNKELFFTSSFFFAVRFDHTQKGFQKLGWRIETSLAASMNPLVKKTFSIFSCPTLTNKVKDLAMALSFMFNIKLRAIATLYAGLVTLSSEATPEKVKKGRRSCELV